MLKIPCFLVLVFKMNPRVIPTFFGEVGFRKTACFPRDFKDCLFSQGFGTWISWAMLKIPRFVVLGTLFVKSGFDRMLVFPGISKMALLDDAGNPTFYSPPFQHES